MARRLVRLEGRRRVSRNDGDVVMQRSFASDNNAPIAPEILAAISLPTRATRSATVTIRGPPAPSHASANTSATQPTCISPSTARAPTSSRSVVSPGRGTQCLRPRARTCRPTNAAPSSASRVRRSFQLQLPTASCASPISSRTCSSATASIFRSHASFRFEHDRIRRRVRAARTARAVRLRARSRTARARRRRAHFQCCGGARHHAARDYQRRRRRHPQLRRDEERAHGR